MNTSSKHNNPQMLLPLLETLKESGGRARPGEIYAEVANRAGLSEEQRSATYAWRGRELSLLRLMVNRTRWNASRKGLIETPEKGVWSITDTGSGKLMNARPGMVLTVYETGLGTALWAAVEDAMAVVSDGSVDLIYTSPPYVGAMEKEYGEWDEKSWLAFMADCAAGWKPKLAPTGSMMLNLGGSYIPGTPAASPYIERLTLRLVDEQRWHLLDRLYYQNPNRLASPMKWVAMRRVRLKPSVEPILWFSPTLETKADNRRVLTPYKGDQKKLLGKERPSSKIGRMPSGHTFGATSFTADNGGAIAHALITASVGGSAQKYYRGCREDGLPPHPATMPVSLASFCIKFATAPGDLVWDPFGGSQVTAAAAEQEGRRWLTNELSLAYVAGGRHRLPANAREDSPLVSAALAAMQCRQTPTKSSPSLLSGLT